jgi:glutamate N-acetyltransferase / amino-acid N-acetyltransferase
VSVTAAGGFVAGGGAIGIKDGNRPDLAIVATADGVAVPAAAVFTTNLACAAPVQVSRAHLVDGHAAAVVVSSGNANAATGEAGRSNARRMCELTGTALGIATGDVLVCSTGLIGIPLPMEPIERGIPLIATTLTGDRDGAAAAATAMLTTDTVKKEAIATFAAGSASVTVGGMAKGAAMLSPAMATMLAVLTTDARVEPSALRRALADAVRLSFDRLCVDGCRSTNDTVAVLASGAAGGALIDSGARSELRALTDAMGEVCSSLAEQMARDAEGATKFVRIVVTGARSDADAVVAARAIAASQLVQCSLFGADPYWGRVLSEIGASGAFCDPEQVDIDYEGVVVCRDGIACDHDAAALAAVMAATELTVHSELHLGHGEATILTTDLSPAYIAENMRTS